MAVDITEAVRLLLIEDNPRHAQLLQETMGDVGVAYSGAQPYTLTHVTGLADGLEKLGARDYDVVLLDLSLPEAKGLDALLRIRERFEDVPVIALVGRGEDELAGQALQAGAQDFLQKGKISGELLARAVRAAVHISSLQAALRSLSFIDGLTGLYNRRGFITLADDTEAFYFVDEVYAPEYERGIRWNDPRFHLTWPIAPVVLSDKDANQRDFDPAWHLST